MAKTSAKPNFSEESHPPARSLVRAWPWVPKGPSGVAADQPHRDPSHQESSLLDSLQLLLAFSMLHEQVRRRKASANSNGGAATHGPGPDSVGIFTLNEVLQLVAERALAVTGADGLAIALAEDGEIVLRAAAGMLRPQVGARIDAESSFSGECFRSGRAVTCDDTEVDPRVNLEACRGLGSRSMVAVPLCGCRTLGVLEAFSARPFAFSENDVRNLGVLAELVVGALRPEDQDRFTACAELAAARLQAALPAPTAVLPTKVPVEFFPDVRSPRTLPADPPDSAPAAQPEESGILRAIHARKSAAEASRHTAALVGTQLVEDREPRRNHRRGLMVMVLVLVVAAGLAAGIWWQARKRRAVGPGRTPNQVVTPSGNKGSVTHAVLKVPGANYTASKSAPPTSEMPRTDIQLPQVTGVEYTSGPDSTTVVVHLGAQMRYEQHHLSAPNRWYFDFRDSRPAPELAVKTIAVNGSLLQRIRIAQPVAGVTRVVLDLGGNSSPTAPRARLETNPDRLVIEMSGR